MNINKQAVSLVAALVLIVAAISFLQSNKVLPGNAPVPVIDVTGPEASTSASVAAKAKLYPRAKEITSPDGFINTDGQPVSLSQYVGKKVVILDIWTYSCINCLRTLPYLNDWYTKYEDKGLVIIGLHTPEFDFEKNIDNVKAAVAKYGVKFPVVLDNDFSTWNAYGNRYWPRKYIIDIDGFVRYDHIGEGGYAETEKQIQELLKERADALGTKVYLPAISDTALGATVVATTEQGYQNPETYFGSARNQYLGNGTPGMSLEKDFAITGQVSLGKFYLNGRWNIQGEYAENVQGEASIVIPFMAGKVFFVASADKSVRTQILVDGKPLGKEKGSDIVEKDGVSIVTIGESRLYNVFSTASTTVAHVLEIRPLDAGLKAFTLTFGN